MPKLCTTDLDRDRFYMDYVNTYIERDIKEFTHVGKLNEFYDFYVVLEIVKSFYNAGKPADLFYYRDIDKKEIDLLIIKENKIYPIEIKKGKEPAKPDKNFSALKKLKMDVEPGMILCMTDELVPYNREAWYVPFAAL